MRKTALALTVLAAIGTSAMAMNYYDVDMYYLRDQSKTLTVEDKQHTGDIAVPYLGRGVSEGAVDQAVADIQNFLNQKYGEGQYFVYTDKDVSDYHMNIYVTNDANQVPAPAPAEPTVATAPTEPAAVPASTVLADGGIVLQLTDFTHEMAAADREQITAILGNYTYGDSAANLADRAEDAVQQYMDQKYGDDFYDVDVKKVADGAYDVQVKGDDNYKTPGAAVAPAQPNVAPDTVSIVLQLTDFTHEMAAADREQITAILGQYTYGDSAANLADRAEDAVQKYMDQKYGDDFYDVDVKKLENGAYDVQIKGDDNYKAPGAAVAPEQPTVAPAAASIVLQLTDFTHEMAAVDREQITAILGQYTHGDSAANLADRAEDAVQQYMDQKYGDDFYDVDVKKLENGAYDVQIKGDDNYKAPGAAVAPEQPTAQEAAFVYELTDFTSQMTDADRNNITHILNQYVAGDTTANLVEKARNEVQHYLNQTYGEETYKAAVNRLETNAYRMEIRMGSSFIERQVAAEQPAAVKDHTVLELMDYTKALPAEDRAAITGILGKYTYGATPDSLSDQAENAVEYYLDQKYGKDVYDVDRVSLGENAFRIEIKADKNYGK